MPFVRKQIPSAFIFVAFLISGAAAALSGASRDSAPSQDRVLDVPYVPTRYPVVDEMLRIAGVGKRDILYDLGCGDGRIVITAALRRGALAVGVDIDPERIAEARKSAALAGLGNRVKFIEGDLFRTDFHEATVVTLYLLTSVNLKLRPRLLSDLRPGSRVVSHNFRMDTWEPDASSEIVAAGIRHNVYLWIIPANIGGTWTWSTRNPRADWVLSVEQAFQEVAGTLTMNGVDIPVKELTLRGEGIRVAAAGPEGSPVLAAVFEGRALANSITGNSVVRLRDGVGRSAWAAVRNPATAKPLDAERGSGIFGLR